MPPPHCSVFYRIDALPAVQPTASKHWRHQEERAASKTWVMRCWCGYLFSVRCKLLAYGPADATAVPKPHCLLPHLNQTGFTFLVSAYPGCPRKWPLSRCRCHCLQMELWHEQLLETYSRLAKLESRYAAHLNDEFAVFLDGFVCFLLLLADFGFHRHVDVHSQLFAVKQKQNVRKNWGPIYRIFYDNLMPKLRSTYDRRLIYNTSYKKTQDFS